MKDRRINRSADDGGNRSALGKSKLADLLAEVILGSSLHAIIAAAEINLVRVHREDLVLRIVPLDLQGEDHLLNLAVHTSVGAIEEESSGELHGEGTGTFGHAAMENVTVSGLDHTGQVDAEVIFEVLVFGADDGVFQCLRKLVVGEQDAALQGKRADRLTVVGIKLRDDVWTIVFEGANLGQIARVDKQKTKSDAQADGANHQERKNKAAKQRATRDPHLRGLRTLRLFVHLHRIILARRQTAEGRNAGAMFAGCTFHKMRPSSLGTRCAYGLRKYTGSGDEGF